MEKKNYITPQIEVVEISSQVQILVNSPSGPGTGTLDPGGHPGTGQSAAQQFLYDDEE